MIIVGPSAIMIVDGIIVITIVLVIIMIIIVLGIKLSM